MPILKTSLAGINLPGQLGIPPEREKELIEKMISLTKEFIVQDHIRSDLFLEQVAPLAETPAECFLLGALYNETLGLFSHLSNSAKQI